MLRYKEMTANFLMQPVRRRANRRSHLASVWRHGSNVSAPGAH